MRSGKHVQVPQWPPGGGGVPQTLLPSGRCLESGQGAMDAGMAAYGIGHVSVARWAMK